MRFYEHRPPRWLAGEEFAQVRMRFRHGRFGSPSWERYEVIPASLASVRRAGSRHAKAGLTDVIPDLPDAACDGPSPGRLPFNAPRTGEQAVQHPARRVRRSMAEPALIAGAALVGALMGCDHHGYGNRSMLAAAGGMACEATWVGLARLIVRSQRTGASTFGGVMTRLCVVLVCLGFCLYGSACEWDDVPQSLPLSRTTFE